jgi:F0F1-type ATP synthase assembly protein I
MVIPGLVGVWLDRKWGISPWLMLVGFVFGIGLSMWHLLQMATSGNRKSSNGGDSSAG